MKIDWPKLPSLPFSLRVQIRARFPFNICMVTSVLGTSSDDRRNSGSFSGFDEMVRRTLLTVEWKPGGGITLHECEMLAEPLRPFHTDKSDKVKRGWVVHSNMGRVLFTFVTYCSARSLATNLSCHLLARATCLAGWSLQKAPSLSLAR